MPDRSRKPPRDANRLAKFVVDAATSERNDQPATTGNKNPAAVALGRLGGLKGGKARAKKLSASERQEIATRAAKARWAARGDDGDGK